LLRQFDVSLFIHYYVADKGSIHNCFSSSALES
jgi:hypothetical protein